MPKLHASPTQPSSGYRYVYGPCATVFQATKTGSWRTQRPVVDQDKCTRCGKCARYCPSDLFYMDRKDRSIPVTVDLEYCKGCGICASVCPFGAIEMVPERSVQ